MERLAKRLDSFRVLQVPQSICGGAPHHGTAADPQQRRQRGYCAFPHLPEFSPTPSANVLVRMLQVYLSSAPPSAPAPAAPKGVDYFDVWG